MDQKRAAEMTVIGLWLIIAVVLTIRFNQEAVLPIPEKLAIPIVSESEIGKNYEITKIVVLSGDTFDLTTKENIRILGKLSVNATEDSKQKVVSLFNNIDNPSIVLKEKQLNGHWFIDLFFMKNGEKINLSEWLQNNNFVYK